MLRDLRTNRLLWVLTALLALAAALIGLLKPAIYGDVIRADLMPGTFGQDLTTAVASVALLVLAVEGKDRSRMKDLVVLGILGYLFYAYGIYVIERVYNVLYYLYLVIFGLSFWSMVYSMAKVRPEFLESAHVPTPLRNISAGFSLFVAVVFSILWISQLLPLIQTSEKIEFLYSVYILDLCFIMPAFAILGVMALKKAGLGLMLLPSMFILGFVLMLSLATSEMVKPLHGLAVAGGSLWSSLVLAVLFLVLAILHLRKVRIGLTGG